jgi:hypothetical protein
MRCECPFDCCGCSCHLGHAPCTHCVEHWIIDEDNDEENDMIIYGYGSLNALYFDIGGDRLVGIINGHLSTMSQHGLQPFRLPCNHSGLDFRPGEIWQNGSSKAVATTDGKSIFDLAGKKVAELTSIDKLRELHWAHQAREREAAEAERERFACAGNIKVKKLLSTRKFRLHGIRVNTRFRLDRSGCDNHFYTLELGCGVDLARSIVETASGNEWMITITQASSHGSDGVGFIDIFGSFWTCLESIRANDLDISEATLEVMQGSLPFEAYSSTLDLLKRDQYEAAKVNWQQWKGRFF